MLRLSVCRSSRNYVHHLCHNAHNTNLVSRSLGPFLTPKLQLFRFHTDSTKTKIPLSPDKHVSASAWSDEHDVHTPRKLPKGTERTVFLAMMGNTVITVLKAAVYMRTGSSAMLAEAIHTLVDTLNQAFLAMGVRQSQVRADANHPYGYGRAAYFWGLVSALGLFWCGAGVSISHAEFVMVSAGIGGILSNAPMQPTYETAAVLTAAFAIDGYVLHRAAKEIVSRALKKPGANPKLMEEFSWRKAPEYVLVRAKAMYEFMKSTRDPFMAAVFMEDLTACSGVLVAGAGISMAYATGNPVWDHAASICIGGMLGGVAIRLVNLNKTYLLGQAVDSKTTEGIKNKILESPAIEAVSQVQSQWIGPTAFAYKAEVDFDGTYLSAKLQSSYRKLFVDAAQKGDLSHELPILLSYYAEDVTRLVERELKDVEDAIRREYPSAVFIELEPDSKDTDLPMIRFMKDKSEKTAEVKRLWSLLSTILKNRREARPEDPEMAKEQDRLDEWLRKAEADDKVRTEMDRARRDRVYSKSQKPPHPFDDTQY